MSVSDLEDSVIQDLGKYLDDFDSGEDSRQYWDLLAIELRRHPKTPQEFKYTAHVRYLNVPNYFDCTSAGISGH